MTYIRVLCKKIKRDYFNYVEDSLQRHKRTGSHNCNIEVLMNHAKVSKMQRKFGKLAICNLEKSFLMGHFVLMIIIMIFVKIILLR